MTMTATPEVAAEVAGRPRAVPDVAGPRPTLPAWRSLLEERWQQRLSTLTELSLAYHDAPQSAQLKMLLREATAARRALSDTEEALARLSGGDFGLCEQCSVLIPAARLLAEPEARYCADCVRAVTWAPSDSPGDRPGVRHGAG
jgi:DnaK suppressor protein